ncbi:hypothetical protein ACH5RR_019359 [Cinchona calisaya]|uniref:Uncharacterized protein n=1 Tax=Cinchona calisaya TaxID=153742 RepID=A0ABD2ZP45_9GENT
MGKGYLGWLMGVRKALSFRKSGSCSDGGGNGGGRRDGEGVCNMVQSHAGYQCFALGNPVLEYKLVVVTRMHAAELVQFMAYGEQDI